MTEIKLFFGDVLVGQSLGLSVEIDNNNYLYSESFKTLRTKKGEVTVSPLGNNKVTAQNYADALELDFSDFRNGNIEVSVQSNIVTISYNESIVEIKSVFGSTISLGTVTLEEPIPDPILDLKLKYWFEFTDVKEVIHRVEISKLLNTDEPIQIYGTCSLEYSETNDTLEAIRGCGLRIDLEANSELTFSDLYTEEERTFSVVYKRDEKILFNGWLSPDGIFESLVSDKWVISLDCLDGIGFLKNLSYVDSNGLIFVGKQSMLEIVSNCLKRTKTFQDILVKIDIIHDGLGFNQDVLNGTYLNVNRFVKEDGNTIMNCDEVLRSVLDIFGAILVSSRGKWIICKPNKLVDRPNVFFFGYDSDGKPLNNGFNSIDFKENLGSQIDGYYPHHVNANQQKTVKNSIGAFRINYKYGLVNSLSINTNLTTQSGKVLGYTILDPSSIFVNSNNGFTVEKSSGTPTEVIKSDSFFVPAFTEIDLEMSRATNSIYNVIGRYKLEVSNGIESFYFNGNEWLEGSDFFTLGLQYSNIKTSPIPIDGDVFLTIGNNLGTYRNPNNGEIETTTTADIEYRFIKIVPISDSLNIVGEAHTFERIENPSSKIAENKEVLNGDSPTDIYEGTIYKSDKTTPTEKWRRLNEFYFDKPILQIMGEERMKMYARPLQVFSGDVYGFFNYLSVFSINGLEGVFMSTAYNYNAVENITSLQLTEILDPPIYDDINYLPVKEYKEVIEPTIKG